MNDTLPMLLDLIDFVRLTSMFAAGAAFSASIAVLLLVWNARGLSRRITRLEERDETTTDRPG